MNSKKDHKTVNSKRTTPKDITPQNLQTKCREPITFKNSADHKESKDYDNKSKEPHHMTFEPWPESIEKYIETTNKEMYKEKNYNYVSDCIDTKVIWKKPQQFFKFVNNLMSEVEVKPKAYDDLSIKKIKVVNNEDAHLGCTDDIALKMFMSTSCSNGLPISDVSVCHVIDKKITVDTPVVDNNDNKKGKKKPADKEYKIIKEVVLSNLKLDTESYNIINWVSSNIQVIIDQNIFDCEVS